MFKWLLLFLLLASPAAAQTCPTRPTGDSTNACASTAFVNNQIPASIPLPLSILNGGNGTSTPSLTAGAGISLSGTWPGYTISGSSGGTPGTIPLTNYCSPTLLNTVGGDITT